MTASAVYRVTSPNPQLELSLIAPEPLATEALAHGGSSEGAPGLRPEYHPHYYAAYFRDPDGNKLCVVCHDEQAARA